MTDEDPVDKTAALIEELEEVTDDISDVSVMDIPVLIIFSALFFIVALQFFTRYVLNDSLGWTEEIARYFLILLGFIGGVSCVRNNKHIFLEFAYHYLPVKTIKPIVLSVETIVTAFWAYAGYLGIQLAERTKSNMVSIDMPKAYLYYVVVVGCFLMAVFAARNLLRESRKPAEQIVREKLQQAAEAQ
ncbi:TRAP transporter small permease [Pacificoceanicola onchidii]|uniref:TRAP transporter small permease n=1 Tax=Pacificoceanicola onchidii TaxID=2562685 RepID=UPI0010A3E7AB|nr:TRAP transporter small permease [Pacificoceanicola onchidii]